VLLSDGDVIGQNVGFRSEWAPFPPFLQCRRGFWVLFKEPSELLRPSPGLGKYRSRDSRLSISKSTRYFPARAPRSPFRRWVFPPREHGRRCDLFGEKPLILLGLHSWLQLDFVQAEHRWHGKSSPLSTNHLCHLLMVATRSTQEVPRAATVDPDPPAIPAAMPATVPLGDVHRRVLLPDSSPRSTTSAPRSPRLAYRSGLSACMSPGVTTRSMPRKRAG
jgi:hypothetical protein